MRTFAQKPQTPPQTTSAKLRTPGWASFGQSREVNSIHHLPGTGENIAAQRMLQTAAKVPDAESTETASPRLRFDFSRMFIHPPAAGAIQAKLAIGQAGDEYEREADRIADQVMATAVQPGVRDAPSPVQRQWGRAPGQMEMSQAPASVDHVLASPGRPLEPAVRAFMEPRFGYDFSQVRVHTGAAAEQSAWEVNATAYTMGHNVVFGADRFAPGTHEGARLIAHELTPVIQQQAAMPVETRGPGVSPSRSGQPSTTRAMALQRQVNDPRSLQVDNIKTPRHVRISEWLVESRPHGGTARTELYWADFEVDAHGIMTASVRTVSPDRAYRSGTLRFGDEFRRALVHFNSNGVEVNAFEGDWSYMSKEEISENLRVFKEGMAKGLTREKAAQGTPTGRVLAASGFEVTHVENVPESQPHLEEEGVRRWRVKAIFRRPPVAPTNPPTPTSGRQVTVKGGTGPSVRSAIGWGLAELAIYLVLGKILGRILKAHHERQVADTWNRLLPKVQQDLTLRQVDIEKLLRETKGQKTIYANVLMDMIVIQSCYEGGCAEGYYGMDFIPPVKVSTEDINRMDSFSGIDPAPAGNIIHYPVTFSFPIAEPSADVLPHIWTIHRMLSRIRTDLKAVGGGTAGEAVALDKLNVALEAAEYTRATVFQSRSAADRFHITAREVDSSISVLGDLSNPAIKDLVKRLGSVRFLLQHGLAHRWPIMV